MSSTYLLTGGAGFIGSHLAESLIESGAGVIALDNLSTGQIRNLGSLREHPRFRFVQGSVLDELMVDELVREADVVVHLAAAVGVELIIREPLRSFTTNIRGSEIVIGAAHRYRRRTMIVSTSEVYGKNGDAPLAEDADRVLGSPTVARWAYSVAKSVDEILAYVYHRERDLPAIVVRLFNTVGPRQSPAYGMVIPRLVRQAVRDEPLTVHGTGMQTRCFCHVQDVVRAFRLLLDEPRAVGEVFNVGSQEEVSISEVAERVIARTGSSSKIELVSYEDAYAPGFEDMLRRVPDTAKLNRLTGWAPLRSLDDILDQTIAEARQELAEL